MIRRAFLERAALLSGAAFLSTGCASLMNRTPAPLYRISLAEWSLHRTIFGGELDHLDFPAAARSMGFDAVEYVNQFFRDHAEDRAYLATMKERARDADVRSLLIMIDREGALGDPDDGRRRQAVENHYKWVDAAHALGCHSIRVNAESEGSWDEQMRLAADGLRRLAEYAEGPGINVIVENHGGLSSNGEWLAGVMEMADHPGVGTLPDFGNFRVHEGEWYDRYEGTRELMPYAKAVSAKSFSFDAEGNDEQTDFYRMMRIVLDAGYRGWVGVEYEGENPDERAGILATKHLLERVRAALAPDYD